MSLLGYPGKLDWKQTADGLQVTLPAEKPCDYTCALKILRHGAEAGVDRASEQVTEDR